MKSLKLLTLVISTSVPFLLTDTMLARGWGGGFSGAHFGGGGFHGVASGPSGIAGTQSFVGRSFSSGPALERTYSPSTPHHLISNGVYFTRRNHAPVPANTAGNVSSASLINQGRLGQPALRNANVLARSSVAAGRGSFAETTAATPGRQFRTGLRSSGPSTTIANSQFAFRAGNFHPGWNPGQSYYWGNCRWHCFRGIWAVVGIGWPYDWCAYPYPFWYDNYIYYDGDVYQPEQDNPETAVVGGGQSIVAEVQQNLASQGYYTGGGGRDSWAANQLRNLCISTGSRPDAIRTNQRTVARFTGSVMF